MQQQAQAFTTASWRHRQNAHNLPFSLSTGTRHILASLYQFADHEDLQCWPSVSTLARLTGYTRRHVFGCLRILEDRNLIMREKQTTKKTNLYHLSPPESWDCTHAPQCTPLVNPSAPPGELQFTPLVNPSAPEEDTGEHTEENKEEVQAAPGEITFWPEAIVIPDGNWPEAIAPDVAVLQLPEHEFTPEEVTMKAHVFLSTIGGEFETMDALVDHYDGQARSVTRLWKFWRQARHLKGWETHQEVMGKEVGLLKSIIKHHGEDTWVRLGRVIASWGAFRIHCEKVAGKAPLALQPNLGTIAAYPTPVMTFTAGDASEDSEGLYDQGWKPPA